MLKAIDPDAEWNQGDRPFLRADARLAIVVLTNEMDCSLSDVSIMDDDDYWNVHPDTGSRRQSSALCWNAGVTCDGPDAMGVYEDCVASANPAMQPIERYTTYLIDELRGNQGKDVVMLAIAGVPSGGASALQFRNWRDGEYPEGDILPEDDAEGATAAHKDWELGIGPGCTADVGDERYIQAIPPLRVREVCESLDVPEGRRCCIESICDDDYTSAITCLGDVLDAAR
jgi:hypothetical protein